MHTASKLIVSAGSGDRSPNTATSGSTSLQKDHSRSQIPTSLLQSGVRLADTKRIYAICLQKANFKTAPALPPRPDWDALDCIGDFAGRLLPMNDAEKDGDVLP